MRSNRPSHKLSKCIIICLIAICGQVTRVHSETTVSSTAETDSTASAQSLSQGIFRDLEHTRQQIYSFWQRKGLGERYGGFYGTLDRAGASVSPSTKGLVQQARHVWAFSTYHLHGYQDATSAPADLNTPNQARPEATHRQAMAQQPRGLLQQQPQQQQRSQQQQQPQQQRQQQGRRQAPPTSRQMAKAAFDFIVQHMYDPVSGMFNWLVTQDGTLLQENKVIYGHWFVLYGFSQYYTAFQDPQARDLALACFRAMDTAWHSTTFGGYDEIPENQIPPAPTEAVVARVTAAAAQTPTRSSSQRRPAAARAVPASAAAAQQPQQREQKVRTLNVAMHGLEALTALHKVTQDPTVLLRVREYLDIICTRLGGSQGLIFEDYVPSADPRSLWTPAPRTAVNYGHNLESTWLVADTLNYLQSISAISPQLARQYRATVMSIGAAAARAGFDRVHGGIYEYGSPATGPESTVKVWWIQAESMLALWKLHQYYSSPSGTGVSPAVGSLARQGSIEDVRLGAPTAKNSNANVNANVNANANANVNANVNANANANANVSQVVGDRARLQYLYMLAKTARFVSEKLTDTEGGGEQFWQVEADGSWVPTNDPTKGTKGNMWKASYHDSRAVLFLQQWMQRGG